MSERSRFSHLEFDDERYRPESIELEGQEPSAEKHLAEADSLYRAGRFEQGLRLYTRCLREDTSVVAAWVGQVRMLVELGELDEARVWSDKALEVFRNNGELLAAKAQACVRAKDYKAAYACSDASLRTPGSSAWRWLVRAEVLLAKQERTSSACFEKALNESGADWFDRLLIGRIYLYYRQAANAFSYLRQAVGAQPDNALAWLTMGDCQRCLGLVAEAAESYQRTLEIVHDFPGAAAALQELRSRSFLSGLAALFGLGKRR